MSSQAGGYTLVEITLVIVLVGVAMAATLFGAELYANSRLMATYTDVETVRRAANEFQARFNALPGDMVDAAARLNGCAACANGNGNGVTGRANQQIFAAQTFGTDDDENTLFWLHLQAAGLFKGNLDLATAMAAGTPWGVSHPEVPMGGGLHVRTMAGFQNDAAGEPISGQFVIWQSTTYAQPDQGGYPATPAQAAQIDEKYDDGRPLSGLVQARGNSAIALNADDGCHSAAGLYREVEPARRCYMTFRIREGAAQ